MRAKDLIAHAIRHLEREPTPLSSTGKPLYGANARRRRQAGFRRDAALAFKRLNSLIESWNLPSLNMPGAE